MSRNAEIVREMYDAFNRGDPETALSFIDPEVEIHYHGVVIDAAGIYRGHRGMVELMRKILSSFDADSFTSVPEEITERGERLAVTVHQRAKGSSSGVPVEIRIGQVWTIRDGKLVRWEIYRNGEEAKAALRAAA